MQLAQRKNNRIKYPPPEVEFSRERVISEELGHNVGKVTVEEIKQLLNLQASSEVAASILKNEVDELKQTKVEGLSEDPEMRLDFGSISSRGIKHDR